MRSSSVLLRSSSCLGAFASSPGARVASLAATLTSDSADWRFSSSSSTVSGIILTCVFAYTYTYIYIYIYAHIYIYIYIYISRPAPSNTCELLVSRPRENVSIFSSFYYHIHIKSRYFFDLWHQITLFQTNKLTCGIFISEKWLYFKHFCSNRFGTKE